MPRRERQKQKRGQPALILKVVSFDDPSSSAEWAADDPHWATVAERVPDPRPGPEALAVTAAERVWVEELVHRLPDRERLTVESYYHDGLTLKVIAEREDCSEGRAWQWHRKALVRLREWVAI